MRVTTPEVHDAAVALVSHVPHVVASELLRLVGGSEVGELALSLAAGSFRVGTRVAGTHPRRTEAMVVDNAAAVARALRRAAGDLAALAHALAAGAPVGEFFDAAAAVRERSGPPAPGGPVAVVALDGGGWREDVLTATRSALVVGVDAAARTLRVQPAG